MLLQPPSGDGINGADYWLRDRSFGFRLSLASIRKRDVLLS